MSDFLNMDMLSSENTEDTTEYKNYKVVKKYEVNSFRYYRLLYKNVLRELSETVPLIINDPIGYTIFPPPTLRGGRYCHSEYSVGCYPDSDRCQNGCFRYWCGACGFGCCGMYSYCLNYKCFDYITNDHSFIFENIDDSNRMIIHLIVNNVRLSEEKLVDYRNSLGPSYVLTEY